MECLECGGLLKTKWQKKFCSQSCAAKYNNRGRVRNKPLAACIYCGNLFVSRHTKHVYCSVECGYKSGGEKRRKHWDRPCSICGKVGYKNASRKKTCGSCYVVMARKKRKKVLIEYAGGKCQLCGYNKYDGALEFHHRDPAMKEMRLGVGTQRAMEIMKKEVDKCALLCANCHREVHGGIAKI